MTASWALASHIELALPMHDTTIDTPAFDPDNTVLDPPSPQKRDYVWSTFLPFIGVHLLCFGALWTGARPVDWVIELDECATDPLDAARESLVYLESLRRRSR